MKTSNITRLLILYTLLLLIIPSQFLLLDAHAKENESTKTKEPEKTIDESYSYNNELIMTMQYAQKDENEDPFMQSEEMTPDEIYSMDTIFRDEMQFSYEKGFITPINPNIPEQNKRTTETTKKIKNAYGDEIFMSIVQQHVPKTKFLRLKANSHSLTITGKARKVQIKFTIEGEITKTIRPKYGKLLVKHFVIPDMLFYEKLKKSKTTKLIGIDSEEKLRIDDGTQQYEIIGNEENKCRVIAELATLSDIERIYKNIAKQDPTSEEGKTRILFYAKLLEYCIKYSEPLVQEKATLLVQETTQLAKNTSHPLLSTSHIAILQSVLLK